MPIFNLGTLKTAPTWQQSLGTVNGFNDNRMRSNMLGQQLQYYPEMLRLQQALQQNNLKSSDLDLANKPTAQNLQNMMLQNAITKGGIENQFLPETMQNQNYAMMQNTLSPQAKIATEIFGRQSLPGIFGNGANQSPQGQMPQQQIPSNPIQDKNQALAFGPNGGMPQQGFNPNQPQLPVANTGMNGTPLTPAQQFILSAMQNKQGREGLAQARMQALTFTTLPSDQREALVAQAAGMGYDPMIASKRFINGDSLDTLAKERGLDPNQLPDPIYPATKGSVTQIQRRQQALAEIDNIQPILTKAVSAYQPRLNGYSPAQVADALKGDNVDKQAQYLAAKALMPEMASLRLKAMGGQVGIEAIREVNGQAMANIKAFESLVSPTVYQKTNEYVDKWIKQGANSANRVGLRPGLDNAKDSATDSDRVTVINSAGQRGTISADKLEAALKAGYKRA